MANATTTALRTRSGPAAMARRNAPPARNGQLGLSAHRQQNLPLDLALNTVIPAGARMPGGKPGNRAQALLRMLPALCRHPDLEAC